MKFSKRQRIAIDAGMFAALAVAASFPAAGGLWHELAGAVFCALALLHNAANAGFYKNIAKGSFGAERALKTASALALAAACASMAVCGAMHSRHLFGFLEIGASMASRQLHAEAGNWAFALASFHLGLHIKIFRAPDGTLKTAAINAAAGCAALCGTYAFAARGFFGKLFLGDTFEFVPENEIWSVIPLTVCSAFLLAACANASLIIARKTKKGKQ